MSSLSEGVWAPVTALSSSADWLQDALSDLSSLASLEQGWDTYGSQRLTPEALGQTRKFLLKFAVHGLPRPDIRPVSGGGVQLEWESDPAELELLVDPLGRAHYLAMSIAGAPIDGELLGDKAQAALSLYDSVFLA